MRAVIQRVDYSSVKVNNKIVGEIDKGLMVLVGVGPEDDENDIEYMVNKIINLRIFEDSLGKMNLSLKDINGEILIVSQFTLYADCRKGRRPSFASAASPEKGEELYNILVDRFKKTGIKKVQTGIYGAHMHISINNNGPVTLLLDSKKLF